MSFLKRLFSFSSPVPRPTSIPPTVLPPETCVVCLSPVVCPFVYDCGHGACAVCTATWVLRHQTCPTCRTKVQNCLPNRMVSWPEPLSDEHRAAVDRITQQYAPKPEGGEPGFVVDARAYYRAIRANLEQFVGFIERGDFQHALDQVELANTLTDSFVETARAVKNSVMGQIEKAIPPARKVVLSAQLEKFERWMEEKEAQERENLLRGIFRGPGRAVDPFEQILRTSPNPLAEIAPEDITPTRASILVNRGFELRDLPQHPLAITHSVCVEAVCRDINQTLQIPPRLLRPHQVAAWFQHPDANHALIPDWWTPDTEPIRTVLWDPSFGCAGLEDVLRGGRVGRRVFG